ncbi:hypothetical protein Q7P35_010830 [Cladosporium inversicolor]
MAVGLRAARENDGGAGDKAETQREARLHEKSVPVRPRPGCLAPVAALPEASAAYLSGRDGDLGGRANSVDSDRQSNVGGRTMGASASRLPDASLAGLFAAHTINSTAPLIHGSGRRPGGSPVYHWPVDTIAWLVDSRDSVVRWSLDSDSQRSPEPPAPRASLEAAIDALAFQRSSAHVDAVCTAGGGRVVSVTVFPHGDGGGPSVSANRVPGRPARIIVPMPFACVEGGLANRLRTTFSTATRRGPQKLGSVAVTPHQNLWYSSRKTVDRSQTGIVAQDANSARIAQRREESIEDPAYVLSVPASGIAQAYLSACSHAASSQPHSVCALMWSTVCHISYMYDLDTGLNHAAEASQVDLYRPHGASPLANITAMPYRMWSNFQYREGSTVCTGLRRGHLYQRLMSRRKQNSLFSANPSGLPGRNSKELHKASRASGNEVRLIVVEGWLAGSPALQSASTYTTMAHCVPPVCCRGPHLRRIAFEINNGMP